MYQLRYTAQASGDLNKLPRLVSQRIIKKLGYFINQNNPIDFAKPLKNSTLGQYRFRIGDYRVLFDVDKNNQITILLILGVKHRREVYR